MPCLYCQVALISLSSLLSSVTQWVFACHLVRRESVLRWLHASSWKCIGRRFTWWLRATLASKAPAWNKLGRLTQIDRSCRTLSFSPCNVTTTYSHHHLFPWITNISFIARTANRSHQAATAILVSKNLTSEHNLGWREYESSYFHVREHK